MDLKKMVGDHGLEKLEEMFNEHLSKITCEHHGKVPRVSLSGALMG